MGNSLFRFSNAPVFRFYLSHAFVLPFVFSTATRFRSFPPLTPAPFWLCGILLLMDFLTLFSVCCVMGPLTLVQTIIEIADELSISGNQTEGGLRGVGGQHLETFPVTLDQSKDLSIFISFLDAPVVKY